MNSDAKNISRADYDAIDRKLLHDLKRRVQKARTFPTNTCPASRHVQIMAECLASGGYPMLHEEPLHCAISMLATVAALYEARAELNAINEGTRQHVGDQKDADVDAGNSGAMKP